MGIKLGLLLILSVAVGCKTITVSGTYHQQMAVKTPSAGGQQWTHHMSEKIDLKIVVPEGWETYNTEAGIVLNEYVGTGVPGTPLNGFLMHIFVPYLNRFNLPDSSDANLAWVVLKQVVSNPDYVGSAVVSEPVAFIWDHYDAAYYLLNNRDRTVTMLLAFGLSNRENLVVCHVSVPEDQSPRIRQLLPALLASLTVNGVRSDADNLNELPDPLEFPVTIE
jgi:hypothetical protein